MEEQKKTTQHRNPIDVIIRAARLYREHLSGNVFLYAFGNQCIEVEFPDWSFKHLAGVNAKLSADRFFRQAADGKSFRVWFSKRHPHDLFLRKARHLHEIHELTQSDCLVLETIHTKSREETPFDFGLTIHDGLQEDVKDYIDKYAPFTMRGENDLGQRILDKALQHPAVVKVTNPERDDGRS